MNISRNEQRALHVLALGGRILHERENGPKITSVTCVTREGVILSNFDMTMRRLCEEVHLNLAGRCTLRRPRVSRHAG